VALKVSEREVRIRMAETGIYTIEELARRSGVSSTTIRNLFKGRDFKSDTLHKLARTLKCNPIDLLSVEGYPDPHLGAPAFTP